MYYICSKFKPGHKKTRRPGGPGLGGSSVRAKEAVLGRTYADGSLLNAYQLVTMAFWNFCSTKAFTSAD